MNPINFEHANVTVAKDQPEYLPLRALLIEGKEGHVVTCWQLSDEEKAKVMETGIIWADQMTFNQPLQPIYITANRDEVFIAEEKKTEVLKPSAVRDEYLKKGISVLRTKVYRRKAKEYYAIAVYNGKGWEKWCESDEFETKELAQARIDFEILNRPEIYLDDSKLFPNG